MATDLTVVLENRPGTLADLGGALGNAGVNIEGGAGFPCEGRGMIHVLVDDAATARNALMASGITIENEREVLVLDVEDKPGVLGETARRLGSAGVNIDLIYLATRTRVVIGVDDLDKARGAV